MAIFISRGKYFSFTENTHPQNTVNKLSYEVATITEDNQETIFSTSSKVPPKYNLNTSSTGYFIENREAVSFTQSYQSNFTEVSKYNSFWFRVKGLKVKTIKTVNVNKNGSTEQTVSFKYGLSGVESIEDVTDDDYEVLNVDVCSLSKDYLITANVYNNYEYKLFTETFNKDWFGKSKGTTKRWYYNYYTNIYVEIFGIERGINYSQSIKVLEQNQKILFNETIPQNSFIQNDTNYNGTPISDYIADTVFKNYSQGRPVATLEWIGSPEVDYGTELIIEPRREYIEEDLITYIVVGKKITYTGGYRETLYLIKKEAD